MNKEEILEKIIKKVVDNGYLYWDGQEKGDWEYDNPFLELGAIVKSKNYTIECWEHIIFSHKFAKAFFGKGKIINYPLEEFGDYHYWEEEEAWVHHLQKMVLEKDPVKYLKKFL